MRKIAHKIATVHFRLEKKLNKNQNKYSANFFSHLKNDAVKKSSFSALKNLPISLCSTK